MRLLAFFALLAFVTTLTAAPGPKKENEPMARAIDVAVTGPAKGKATEPTVIENEDELAKTIGDENAIKAIKKAVDFKKEKALFFAWAGSGQDKITFAADEGKVIKFTYTRGFTRDLRQHKKLFALSKDAKFTVEVGSKK